MVVRLDRTLSMPPIALAVLLLGFIIVVINGIAQFFTLTPIQTSVVGFVAFVLVALSAMLTTVDGQ